MLITPKKRSFGLIDGIAALGEEKSFGRLREVILLEEFKNHIPSEIRTHLDEQGTTELHKAGMLADSYELTHRRSGSGAQSSRLDGRAPR